MKEKDITEEVVEICEKLKIEPEAGFWWVAIKDTHVFMELICDCGSSLVMQLEELKDYWECEEVAVLPTLDWLLACIEQEFEDRFSWEISLKLNEASEWVVTIRNRVFDVRILAKGYSLWIACARILIELRRV